VIVNVISSLLKFVLIAAVQVKRDVRTCLVAVCWLWKRWLIQRVTWTVFVFVGVFHLFPFLLLFLWLQSGLSAYLETYLGGAVNHTVFFSLHFYSEVVMYNHHNGIPRRYFRIQVLSIIVSLFKKVFAQVA